MDGTDFALRALSLALDQIQLPLQADEVPVRAVLVRRGPHGAEVITAVHNGPITTHDRTAHAELVTLRQAAAQLVNSRLPTARCT